MQELVVRAAAASWSWSVVVLLLVLALALCGSKRGRWSFRSVRWAPAAAAPLRLASLSCPLQLRLFCATSHPSEIDEGSSPGKQPMPIAPGEMRLASVSLLCQEERERCVRRGDVVLWVYVCMCVCCTPLDGRLMLLWLQVVAAPADSWSVCQSVLNASLALLQVSPCKIGGPHNK